MDARNTKALGLLLWPVAALAFIGCVVAGNAAYDALSPELADGGDAYGSYADVYDPYASCAIRTVRIRGMLATYLPPDVDGDVPSDATSSEDVVDALRAAEGDDTAEGIILDIDSPGGYPVAAEEIANALRAVGKPTVALIRQQGMSAAYWAATGADRIVASALSDVGSIGVTMSYVDNVEANRQNGNGYVSLSAGKYKDAGDPNRRLTDEERSLFQRDLDIVHALFIDAVAANRALDVSVVRAVADGSSVLGGRAKELGLIDEIGGLDEAAAYIAAQTGADRHDVCW